MALNRAASYGYHVVDDFHSLIDEAKAGRPRILTSRSRKLLVCGMIVSGVTLSIINKIGAHQHWHTTPFPCPLDLKHHPRRLTHTTPMCPAVYEIPAAGRDGVVHTFEKPWFMVLVMFLGEHPGSC